MPNDDGALDLTLEGRIVSLVRQNDQRARFEFRTDPIETTSGKPASILLRLNWQHPPSLHSGQRWRLKVRLRHAHGFANPGSWDYEGWLRWQGIRYAGYVRDADSSQLLAEAVCCRLQRWRADLAARIEALPISAFSGGVLRALVVGDQSALSNADNALLRTTGTSHLMAISGLHIGLVAGLGLWFVGGLWRRIPRLCGVMPARHAGLLSGLSLAVLYAALAGFSLPTLRALIMLCMLAIALLTRRQGSVLHALAGAAVAVLLWDPPSVLSAGFWLSFGAVLTIVAVAHWTPRGARWSLLLRIQLALAFSLWPILAMHGIVAGPAAPLINLLLVPLFSVLVVPFGLIGAALLLVWPGLGTELLVYLSYLLDALRGLLAWTTTVSPPMPAVAAIGPTLLLAYLLGLSALLAPSGFPLRRGFLPLLLVPWLPRAAVLPDGAFDLQVLDVGQGLSVLVTTRDHTLLFDTGPQFPSGFSTADAVVLPYLAQIGRKRLDALVLSHGDKDHAGGVDTLLDNVQVDRLLSGEPARIGQGASPCRVGQRWQWNGVEFEILAPDGVSDRRGNNASCVLSVSNDAGRALLTGDIEASVERGLVGDGKSKLRSDVVIAPHHGSRSSSSPLFVAATSPRYVVFTAGWANRYHFPAADVVARWRQAGATPLDTGMLGAIRFRFDAQGQISEPLAYRIVARRFWWHDSGSANTTLEVSSAEQNAHALPASPKTAGPRS